MMLIVMMLTSFFVSLKDPDNHIYLIIHNIDGPMLRGEKNQQALGQLASIPNMHLLASIDHINAPLGLFSHLSNNYFLVIKFSPSGHNCVHSFLG